MIKNNKVKLIICSLLILLPILFGVLNWNELPDTIPTHWGIDGQPDGFSSKPVAVFIIPCFLFLLYWACMFLESRIGSNAEQNKKAFEIVFWIVPVISVVVNGAVYLAALGIDANPTMFAPLILGFALMIIGNYMPKVKQNRTLGIKLKWTLNNEENWNATHRFAGKVWFFGGFLVIFCALLPESVAPFVLLPFIFVLVFLPMLYSYNYHKKQERK